MKLLFFVLALSCSAALTLSARAQPLIIDGTNTASTSCPGGVVGAGQRSCAYGGVHTFTYVDIRNGGRLEVVAFDGADKVGTGNAVIITTGRDPGNNFSIRVDQTSRVTAKGRGYRGVDCDNGAGPAFAPLAGGRGGCAVRDSGGGGGHFGRGGKGTKDCFLYDPVLGYDNGSDVTCTFPQEWEEACGYKSGSTCIGYSSNIDPDRSSFLCYGGGNASEPKADPPPPASTPSPYTTGKGDALPDVAGRAFWHSIFQPEFGAAGGDKGCRDGYESGLRAGSGGGRIVLFAANGAQNGLLRIDGRVIADGNRGCSLGNDSAGAGAGGTVLLIGDTVQIGSSARISAHGGRGGDSQPKCLPCTNVGSQDICETGQTCTTFAEPASGKNYNLCSPCNCTPCTGNGDCTFPGQTCKNLGGDLGQVCADSGNKCTPYDVGDNAGECIGTQNDGVCDDCAGGGGGGIINVQSRQSSIAPEAIFDVRGGAGGICPICSGESGGGAGELQLDSAYVGELCDGWDNDFDGATDDALPALSCPAGSVPSCAGGVPQDCIYDRNSCLVPSADSSPRFALVLDSSGSMLNDVQGFPTFGDGSVGFPGVDTSADADNDAGDDARLYIAKRAVGKVLAAFPESQYALARYYQDVGIDRSCQTASNFECALSCCSYDDPTDNPTPSYPAYYPGNRCVMSGLYPAAGYSFANPGNSNDINIGWSSPDADCINYAGSCGPPRRGAQFLVGFDMPLKQYLMWLDGRETDFMPGSQEGNHCDGGDCELRATGPTPLAGALNAAESYLKPIVTCDGARDCRTYAVILLTDGAESCQGDPVAAAAALLTAVPDKEIKTYVIGFSVRDEERAQLNAIALAGGTDAGDFTGGNDTAFFAQNEDELANAIASIIASSQVFEVCNDLDDDCDGLTDEDFPDKGMDCNDGLLGLCLGRGTRQCKADGAGTECVITDPGADPIDEVCNQLDDDCDGLVDEGLTCTECVPETEICDGKDNDCDKSVDEQPDVSDNDDRIGVDCGELPEGNDLPPCQLGQTECINGEPVCTGFVGPSGEMCNLLDDDCDGETDEEADCPQGTICIDGRCVAPCLDGEFPCPGGFVCVDGYCLPATCDRVTCSEGQTCVDGICVVDSVDGTGGDAGDAVDGGGPAAAGSAGDATGAGGMGGTSGNNAVKRSPFADRKEGVAAAGGGCACQLGSHPAPSPVGPIAICALFAALFWTRRRKQSAGGAYRRQGAVERAAKGGAR